MEITFFFSERAHIFVDPYTRVGQSRSRDLERERLKFQLTTGSISFEKTEELRVNVMGHYHPCRPPYAVQ